MFSEHINCDSIDAVKSLLESCRSNGYGLISGKPYKLPVAPEKRNFRFMTLNGLNRIIEHLPSDQVISLETGISLLQLQEFLAKTKQWLPVYAANDQASLMDFINSGDGGPLEHSYGEARDIVLGINSLLGSGELIKCGGKVVKNVTGYDLPKLFCGSHGTLQIPISAHLRLYAKPDASISLIKFFKNEDEAFSKSNQIIKSGLPTSCLEVVDVAMLRAIANKDSNLDKVLSESQDTLVSQCASTTEHYSKETVAICLQLHGMESVIETLKKELVDLLLKDSLIEVDKASEERLWKELSRPSQSRDSFVLSLCAPRKTLSEILKTSATASGKIGWTARPSKYKAFIEFVNLDSCLQFRRSLNELSTKFTDTITIAHPTESLNYSVGQLPKDDETLKELKRRIRQGYDPVSVLNPIAKI